MSTGSDAAAPRGRRVARSTLALLTVATLLSACDCATFEQDGTCPPQDYTIPFTRLSQLVWGISSD